MRLQRYQIQELLSVDRNTVDGLQAIPREVFNLVPYRLGGYTPLGSPEDFALIDPGESPVSLGDLLSYDSVGIAAFDKEEKYQLFDGKFVYDNAWNPVAEDFTGGQESVGEGDRTHIHNVGIYAKLREFFVMDRNDRPRRPENYAFDHVVETEPEVDPEGEDFVFQIRASGGAAMPTCGTTHRVAFYDAAFDGSILMACVRSMDNSGDVRAGGIARSVDRGETWQQVLCRLDDPGELEFYQWRSIATDGEGTWVAVGVNHLARSVDGGDTWTVIKHGDNGIPSGSTGSDAAGFYRVFYHDGAWYATGNNVGGFSGGIWRSTNGGLNWSKVNDHPSQDVSFVFFDGLIYAFGRFDNDYYTSPDGETWTSFTPSDINGNIRSAATDGMAILLATSGTDGGLFRSTDGEDWSQVFENQRMHAVIYNTVTNTWFALRSFVTGSTFLLESEDGEEWDTSESTVHIHELPHAHYGTLTQVNRFALIGRFFEHDTEVFPENFSSGFANVASVFRMVSLVEPEFELPAGDYELFAIRYFMTAVGRFAFEISTFKFEVEEEHVGRLTVSVEESLPENTFITIFLNYKDPELPEDEQMQELIEAGTISPDEDEVVINTIPIGATFGHQGAFIAPVFRSLTSEKHLGRTWGVLSSDKDDYEAYNLEDLRPGELGSRVVIGFTMVGWDNLARRDDRIYLSPIQSKDVTAIVSSRDNIHGEFGGLIVFFENEAFVISGDPSIPETVEVRPYPSVVGCDSGVIPARLAGTPFVIWHGEIYAVEGGEAINIGKPVWLRNDPFRQIVSESVNRSILAVTESGKVYRYLYEYQFWCNNPIDGIGNDDYLLPGIGNLGSYYILDGDASTLSGDDFTEDYEPRLAFDVIDIEQPFRRKKWRYIRIPTFQFDGDIEASYDVEDNDGVVESEHLGDGIHVLAIPIFINGAHLELKLNFSGMASTSSIGRPIVIDYILRDEGRSPRAPLIPG